MYVMVMLILTILVLRSVIIHRHIMARLIIIPVGTILKRVNLSRIRIHWYI